MAVAQLEKHIRVSKRCLPAYIKKSTDLTGGIEEWQSRQDSSQGVFETKALFPMRSLLERFPERLISLELRIMILRGFVTIYPLY